MAVAGEEQGRKAERRNRNCQVRAMMMMKIV
jgi:hypothetical protein